jgi:IS5 family transposase
MFRDGAYLQAYNAQIAVDDAHQIIVAAALSNQAPDAEYFMPMLDRVVDNCDAVPVCVTADSGYFSTENVRAAEHMGTEPLISVGKHRNDGTPSELRQGHRTDERLAMLATLDTRAGRAAYARRKSTVEPVFGQIRSARRFQQLSFRGLLKNRCEWAFVCLTHNLLKLFRAATPRLATANC